MSSRAARRGGTRTTVRPFSANRSAARISRSAWADGARAAASAASTVTGSGGGGGAGGGSGGGGSQRGTGRGGGANPASCSKAARSDSESCADGGGDGVADNIEPNGVAGALRTVAADRKGPLRTERTRRRADRGSRGTLATSERRRGEPRRGVVLRRVDSGAAPLAVATEVLVDGPSTATSACCAASAVSVSDAAWGAPSGPPIAPPVAAAAPVVSLGVAAHVANALVRSSTAPRGKGRSDPHGTSLPADNDDDDFGRVGGRAQAAVLTSCLTSASASRSSAAIAAGRNASASAIAVAAAVTGEVLGVSPGGGRASTDTGRGGASGTGRRGTSSSTSRSSVFSPKNTPSAGLLTTRQAPARAPGMAAAAVAMGGGCGTAKWCAS